MKKIILGFIIGAGLWACSSVNTLSVQGESMPVSKQTEINAGIDSLISPYRDSLSQEMNVVIAKAENDFIIGRPNSNIGNWVADAVFANQTKHVRLAAPTFCLLNTGGIRSTINKGNVTIGDIFKVMPFDNEIVWVQLPVSVIPEIEAYIKQTGGEPIAHATIDKGKLIINGMNESSTHVWVITSDYLMNGGDKMNFFSQRTDVSMKGKLMRDALIEEARFQGTLMNDPGERIKF